MADKLAILLEAEKRGILPPEKKALLDAARKRGLIHKDTLNVGDYVHPDDITAGLAMPDTANATAPQAIPFDPMAQGAPAPEQPPTGTLQDQMAALPGQVGDQLSAGFSAGVEQLPIVGPAAIKGLENLKGRVQGRSPEDVASTDAAQVKANPVAANIGRVSGAVLPYALGGLAGGPIAGALGLEGGLGTRLAMTGLSQEAINTGDRMQRNGEDLPTAARNAAIPSLESIPFALFGKGAGNASRDAAAATLDAAGVPLSAGQRTGSKMLKLAESELGGGAAFNEKQANAFSKAAMKSAGMSGDRATTEVMAKTKEAFNTKFGDLAARTDIPFDTQLQKSVGDVVFNYDQTAGAPAKIVATMAHRLQELASNGKGTISGEAYKNFRSTLGEMSTSGDPATQSALHDLQSALDDAVERNLPTKLVNEWKSLRNQYQNYLVIRKSVAGAGPEAVAGIITPANIRSATANIQGISRYTSGVGDTNKIGRAGVELMTPLANSNTAARSYIRNGGIGLLGLVGALGGKDAGGIAGALGGAAAGMAVPALAGRALLSGPGRFILGSRGSMLPAIAGRATVGSSNTMSLTDFMKAGQSGAAQ